jgi:hypothetical protein
MSSNLPDSSRTNGGRYGGVTFVRRATDGREFDAVWMAWMSSDGLGSIRPT